MKKILLLTITIFLSLNLFAQTNQEEPDLLTTINYLQENWTNGKGEVFVKTLNDAEALMKDPFGSSASKDVYDSNVNVDFTSDLLKITVLKKDFWDIKRIYKIDLSTVDRNSIKMLRKGNYYYLQFSAKVSLSYSDEFSRLRSWKRAASKIKYEFRWGSETNAKRITKAFKHAVKSVKGPVSFFEED